MNLTPIHTPPSARKIALLLLTAAALFFQPGLVFAETAVFAEGLRLLTESSFTKKQAAIEILMAGNEEKTISVFNALLNSNLFYTKIDKVVVLAVALEQGYRTTEIISGRKLDNINKAQLEKIIINNKMRTSIKSALAELNLASPDSAVRLAAINEYLKDLNPGSIEILTKSLAGETDQKIQRIIQVALAITTLREAGPAKKAEAIDTIKKSLHPAAKEALASFIESENEPILNAQAKKALEHINAKGDFFHLLETIFFGLSMGSVLVLTAIGLAITFGVVGVINMAHGELIMIGAYTTYVVQQLIPRSLGMSLFVAIPAAFVVSGLVGIAIEKGIIRFLHGRPLETLLATFGVSLVLQQSVRTIFSPLNKTVETPVWMRGSFEINDVLSLTMNRVSIVLFCFLVFGILFLIMKKTTLGLQVRAVAQNRVMARAMGVNAARVDALTFGLGSGIAGVAGVALSQLTNVGPNLGQSYIVDSFMVVVFGGVGNLWGTMLGGLTLGVTNKFLEPWAGAVLAKIVILLFIILFIQKRPQGLFPQKGRAAGA